MMKPHILIDRLAALDEAEIAEPEVAPGVDEPATEPQRAPSRAPRRDPFELPPDFEEPDKLPHPKSEGDESESIRAWLEATQQPIQDWDWDGTKLSLMLDDGSTEIYDRRQLEELGIFDTGQEMAFAESRYFTMEEVRAAGENFMKENPNLVGPDGGTGAMLDNEPDLGELGRFLDDENAPESMSGEDLSQAEPIGDDATGTLDMILGRTPCSGASVAAGPEVIELDGDAAEEIGTAVGDLVGAILGVVGGKGGGNEPEKKDDSKADKKDDKEGSKKKDKPKKEKEKSDDKDDDKNDDKDDDKEETEEK